MNRKIYIILVLLSTLSFSVSAVDLKPYENEKGKWGYADLEGNVVIEPTYETAEEFIDGKAKVSSKQKFGIIDTLGNVIVPLKYANIGAYNKYGLAQINSGGKVEDGVVTGGKLGYINEAGEIVLPAKYDEIGFFDKTNTAWVKSGKKYGLINISGALISEVKYSAHSTFEDNGICWVNVGGVEQADKTVVGGLWGYLNTLGEEIVAPKYLSVRKGFVDGISWVQNSKRKYAYIKESGELLNGVFYDQIADQFSGNLTWVKDDNKFGYINIQGETVTELKYDGAYSFSGGMAAVGLKESKKSPVMWGYIGEDGQEIFAPQFESVIIKANKGRAFIQQNGKWAFVDDKGNILSDFEFSVVSEITDDAKALVSTTPVEEGQPIKFNYILNPEGKKINSIPYNNIANFSDGFALVSKVGDVYCWIDEDGKEYFDNQYTKAGDFVDGLAFAYKDGKSVYINKSGDAEVILNTSVPVFGLPFDGDYALVMTEDNKWGCVDKAGVVVVPLELSVQADAKYLLDNVYVKEMKPLGMRYVRLMDLYKNTNKCSITDVLPNESWAY